MQKNWYYNKNNYFTYQKTEKNTEKLYLLYQVKENKNDM